ncbi:MAG: type II toxin-antitoxin system Phd/YefM family antitoxin [Candidatus Margulisbacteria bacterium]|jgi:PHD/YefM family antitoxin component YafN of YafNO toxin-antitoxin module|nr:type II toxin-antitoxin system Phd/YefM family antitoxin [Candidatus Margulisiibacteriota bacterium]
MLNTLPKIRPITDLKKTGEISAYCHQLDEPVILTKNGYSDLVIMSIETFERAIFQQEVYRKLAEAEKEYKSGAPTVEHKDFLQKMRAKLKNGQEI